MKNTKLYIIIAVSTIIVVVVLFAFFSGKRKPKAKELPSDETGNQELNDLEKSNVLSITRALFNDMDGINFGHDEKPFQNLLSLSDRLFVAVWNKWNELYFTDSGTLREMIEDEFSFTAASYQYEFNTLKEAIFSRMDKLNLV